VSLTAVDRFPRTNFLLASTSRTHEGTDRITNQYDNGFIPVEVDYLPQDSSKAPGTFSAFFLTYLRTASCCGILGCDTGLRDHEYNQSVGNSCFHLSSAPKMEAVWFSETLVPVYQA
jgi:hypothetical protein